jgi:molecular chaperone GrpE
MASMNDTAGVPHDDEAPIEGVRVTDRRRIDPQTYQVRESAQPAPSTLEAEIEVEVSDIEAKVAELTDDLRRVHAEYANYRKRVDREREAARDITVGAVLADLLPILDDLERAREHGELDGAFRSVGEALETTTTRLGLERFGTVGEPFDPMVHEALTSEVRDDVDGPTVAMVYQAGYRHAGRVLRPARVAVADRE